MAVICEVMILMSVGAVIMGGADNAHSSASSLILRGTIYNPVVVAIGVGAVLAVSGAALPGSLNGFLSFLGASAAPTALFAIGGSLASRPISLATGMAAAGATLVKLVAYPLTVWCVLAHVLHLEHFWTATGVVLASLPSASSNYVLAQRYQADADQVSAGIVLSTIVSVGTVPLVGWLMGS
jgi:predicted permease